MGRKKTEEQEMKPVTQEQEDALKTVETTDEAKEETNVKSGLSYTGSITISIMNGNKVVSKKHYHNAGTAYLFKFLCECLGGQENKLDRPTRVRLFTITPTESPTNPVWTSGTSASAALVYDTTPIVTQDPGTEAPYDYNRYKVSYHFRIPYAYITKDRIAKIALYTARNADMYSAMSAYFCIIDKETGEYAPIEMPASAYNNYSIIIEWDLAITNQIL